jgi:RNA methyltransferase, TrmH family
MLCAMRPDQVIRSQANPLLKRVGAVAAGRERSLVLLEGERLVRDALGAGWLLDLVLLSERLGESELSRALEGAVGELRWVEEPLLERVSDLETAPGILALARRPVSRELALEEHGPRDLLLVAAGIADPGNLGALARSAEAAGAAGLVTLGGASPWRPKALRGSMGSLLRLPVFDAGAEDAAALRVQLDRLGFRSVRAELRGGAPYDQLDWSGRVALWVASETGRWPAGTEDLEAVTIPMAGAVESLNVTVAASILLYSAGRVRSTEEAP